MRSPTNTGPLASGGSIAALKRSLESILDGSAAALPERRLTVLPLGFVDGPSTEPGPG